MGAIGNFFVDLFNMGPFYVVMTFCIIFIALFMLFAVIALFKLVKVHRQTLKFLARATKEGYYRPIVKVDSKDDVANNLNVDTPTEEVCYQDTDEPLDPTYNELSTDIELAIEDDKVVVPKKTIEEKYNQLSAESKAYYDDVMSYAESLPAVKRSKSLIADTVIFGRDVIVKTQIKQGKVVCMFVTANAEMKRILKEEKATVKEKLTAVKVIDERSAQTVKTCIDLAYKTSQEEKHLKHLKHLEKRREDRKSKLNK